MTAYYVNTIRSIPFSFMSLTLSFMAKITSLTPIFLLVGIIQYARMELTAARVKQITRFHFKFTRLKEGLTCSDVPDK